MIKAISSTIMSWKEKPRHKECVKYESLASYGSQVMEKVIFFC